MFLFCDINLGPTLSTKEHYKLQTFILSWSVDVSQTQGDSHFCRGMSPLYMYTTWGAGVAAATLFGPVSYLTGYKIFATRKLLTRKN